ncbi:MAG TPA: hypothetical protein PLQ20_01480 [Candidatus Paceibacterota bacterium]|nr:hypothetical protein [Candidatus Paceibacterota bacterium]
MLLTHKGKQTTEDIVIEALGTRGMLGPDLLRVVREKLPFLPKETFYRVVRSLLQREVLSKHNALYELNLHWLEQIYRFSKKHIETAGATDTDQILSFKEGDSITYKFKNAESMGVYWAHIYDLVFHRHNPKIPILVYHPHEWLIHTRNHAESLFLNRFEEDKKNVHFAIGGDSQNDKDFKKFWNSKYRQIATGINIGLKNNEYINVLDDFIFKVSLGKKVSNDIDIFFKTHKNITEENLQELNFLTLKRENCRMIFTKSKKEADKYRAKFKKYFYTIE